MSSVYSTEPATTGRVILQTSHGPLDVNLWCKECPTSTRAFLQLCLDGYYDGMIFHRILNDFLIQCGSHRKREEGKSGSVIETGDEDSMINYIEKQSSGSAGLSSMNKRKLELSPRIRFNHRGQVALALPLDSEMNVENESANSDGIIPDDLKSLARQFFITLDEAPFLNSKHVIFGTVTGATVFNALRIGKTDTVDANKNDANVDEIAEDGQPSDMQNAPTIKSVKIDFHPFDDIVLTAETFVPWKAKNEEKKDDDDIKKRRKKRKGKKDLNVLSFGGEMEEVDDGFFDGSSTTISGGMQSSHEALSGGKKKRKGQKDSMNVARGGDQIQAVKKGGNEAQDKDDCCKENNQSGQTRHSEMNSNNPSRSQIQNEDRFSTNESTKVNYKKHNSAYPQSSSLNHDSTSSFSMKESETRTHIDETTVPPVKKMSAVEARRLKYLSKAKNKSSSHEPKGSKQRDEATMSKLLSFKSKMFEVKSSKIRSGDNRKDGIEEEEKDNSLAARMSMRSELDQKRKEDEKKNSRSVTTYSGQLLEKDQDSYLDNTWLKTKFKCKKHMDHSSKGKSMGGDGRDMDEYQVIDGSKNEHRRRRNKHDRHRTNQQKGEKRSKYDHKK